VPTALELFIASGPGAVEPGPLGTPATVTIVDVRNATILFGLGRATAEQCRDWATILLNRDDVTIDDTFGESTRDVLDDWSTARYYPEITMDTVAGWQTILDADEFA